MNMLLAVYEIEATGTLLWPFEYQAVKKFRATWSSRQKLIIHWPKTPLAIEHQADFSK